MTRDTIIKIVAENEYITTRINTQFFQTSYRSFAEEISPVMALAKSDPSSGLKENVIVAFVQSLIFTRNKWATARVSYQL